MKKITTLPTGLVFILIVTILITFRSWLSMGIELKVWSPLLAFLMLGAANKYLRPNNVSIVTIVLCLIAYFTFTRGNLNAYIGSFLFILPFLVFCCIRQDIRIRFLFAFNKVFASIVGASTFFWILHLLGVPLLHSPLSFGENYAYENYYFFLDFRASIRYLDFFSRFFSIFVEPSIIGMMCAILLFLDGFRLKKWYNIVYLIALLLSFSLAGYILFAIALIPHVLYDSSSRSRISYIAIVGMVILAGYYAMYMADHNSVIYQMFGQRLEWNEDAGSIVGYDRSDENIDDFLKTQFWNSGNVFFGFGPDLAYHGVDWKAFLAKYGLVPMLFYTFFLFYCFLKNKSRFGLWWFILFFLIFCRGFSVMFWPGFLMLYIVGLDYLWYSKNKKLNAWDIQ